MKKQLLSVLSVFLCVLLLFQFAVPAEAATAAEIKKQIVDTYNAAKKLRGSSFDGWCGQYVGYQLQILGINTSYVGGAGKNQFDYYKDRDTTSGGYNIAAYSASDVGSLKTILNLISNNGTVDVYNLLAGFEIGWGSDGQTSGHVTFIHAILGGTVYASESFNMKVGNTTIKEGQPIVLSINDYCSKYSSCTLDGVVYFTKSPVYKTVYQKNVSGKNYLFGTGLSGSGDLNSTYYYSRDTSVATLSIDRTVTHNGYNSLAIKNTSAGANGKDLAFVTFTNDRAGNGWTGDNRSLTLSFWAKASAANTKMYFRWGYGSYTNVTLTQDWAFYTVPMDKVTTYGSDMHPYVDRAGTVWLCQLQLEDGTTATSFRSESVKAPVATIPQLSGRNYKLPTAPTLTGYTFDGWYTQKVGGEKITSSTAVKSGKINLYAHWRTDAPIITAQPQSVTVPSGSAASFSVTATGTGLTYQWQYKRAGASAWTAWSGKTAATLTVTAASSNNGCQYRCAVTNVGGTAYSNAATLTVTVAKPTITTQPKSVSLASGECMTFSCAATGEGTLSYQWQYKRSGATAWSNWSGKTDTILNVMAGSNNSGCQYRCAVTNAGGTTYTNAATLTVTSSHNCPGAAFTDMPAKGTIEHTAIDWAIRSGVTNGTSATKFSPSMTVTRSQVVTFLWRACGSPEPKTTKNPFTDVKTTDWFYKAVLWAVEQGITNGTSANKFSPNTVCSRSQTLTFLYRQQGSPAVGSVTVPYTDVTAGAFYENAMKWAYSNGIDKGVTATTFAPNANCVRVSTVVFLYRAISGQGRLS